MMDLLELDLFDEEDFASLRKMILQMEKSLHEKNIGKFAKLNIDFHEKIWTYNRNAFLYRLLLYCVTQIKIHGYLLCRFPQESNFFSKSLNEHKYILDALKNKDKSRLKALVLTHWVLPSLTNEQ